MTDFGKRIGAHKTTHQDGGTDEIDVTGLGGKLADDQPIEAHALGSAKHTAATLAELNAKVSDATLDKDTDTRTPTAHKASHQNGGTDEINVTGLVGATARAILGDATAGRVLRKASLTISNGSTASTLKCTMTAMWNGDAIAEQDNIGKDATTGHFHLTAAGTALTILNAGLTGSALDGHTSLYFNASGTALLVSAIKTDAGLVLNFIGVSDGVGLDLTVLVDTGIIIPHILYITDA